MSEILALILGFLGGIKLLEIIGYFFLGGEEEDELTIEVVPELLIEIDICEDIVYVFDAHTDKFLFQTRSKDEMVLNLREISKGSGANIQYSDLEKLEKTVGWRFD